MRGLIEEMIKTIPTVKPRYQNETEKVMNPAFQLLENSCPLRKNQKKIFVLRKDLKFALGVKNFNSGLYNGKNELYQAIEEKSQSRINLDDQLGHPSLAMPEKDYDGSAYLAGWICQRKEHIEIILISGRFHRVLEKQQQKYLELYTAQRVMNAYGGYDIHVHDYDEDNAYCFFNDIDQFDPKVRKYSTSTIQKLNQREAEIIAAREKFVANKTAELKIDIEPKSIELTQTILDNKILKKKTNAAITIQRFFRNYQINKSRNILNPNMPGFSIGCYRS